MFNEINKQTSETKLEDLPFVKVADLCAGEAVFCFLSLNLKKNVKTDYGVQDIAYCKIHILKTGVPAIPALDAENKETAVHQDDECMVSVKQTGLVKLIRYALENGQDLTGEACRILKATSKKGNSYYYFEDA